MNPTRFPRPERVVVKVGSSSLCQRDSSIDLALVKRLVAQIAVLRADGTEVVLVSSGAVAAGLAPLGFARRPADTPGLQAAASVGQGLLMHIYQACFAEQSLACGQVLLTPDGFVDRTRYLNARHTFEKLLELRAVPVVNENDTVATDELRFGDNDRLAALVASMLRASLLVLLSDVDGVLDGDPASRDGLAVLDCVPDPAALDPAHVAGAGSDLGSGGMLSKLEAVRIARFSGTHTVIANAGRDAVVVDAVRGARLGTWFPADKPRPKSRKLWIALAPTPRGTLVVDEGAVRALVERGSSLLPAGVVEARGDFRAGDAVDVVGPDSRLVARGLSVYERDEVLRLRGRSTRERTAVLGGGSAREVIHRDSLVIVA